jgi:hypothetical protein
LVQVPAARTRLWLGALAFFGVVAAHVIAYQVAAPESHAHNQLLESTGHRYWIVVVAIALGALVAGLAGFGARVWLGAPPVNQRSHSAIAAIAVRLAPLQALGFLALETGERFVSGAGPEGLLAEPAVQIGLLTQVVVALLGALLLVAVGKTVHRLLTRLDGLPRAPRVVTLRRLPRANCPLLQVASGGATVRAPPVTAEA